MSISMIWDHLSLVLSALILAVAAGVPLGLLAYLSPGVGKALLWVVDLIQTIPALALLGVIMVITGPGSPTAMIGLALYSLLPIARNTALGLSQVPGHLKEAAAGMGMSPAYRLLHVDVPLAAPMLVTGIRIAAVNAIGTAVFASFVGGGGLGGLFYTAIRQQDMAMILGGTAILMAMALVLDAGLGWVERRMSGGRSRLPLPVKAAGGAVLVLASIALVVTTLLPSHTEGRLTLYDGDYSEVKLMHAMVELLVEDKTDLDVVILDQMTQVNNHNELKGAKIPAATLCSATTRTVVPHHLSLGMAHADIRLRPLRLLPTGLAFSGSAEGPAAAGQCGAEQHLFRIGVYPVPSSYRLLRGPGLRTDPVAVGAGFRAAEHVRFYHEDWQHEITLLCGLLRPALPVRQTVARV